MTPAEANYIDAVRIGGPERTQAAFDACEEWIDFAFGQSALPHSEDDAEVKPVGVKPLGWSPFMDGYCLHTETRLAACSTAESIIGTYAIGRKHTYMKTTKPEERAFDDHLSSAWWVETPSRKLIGPFNSDVLAKAAAQADLQRRVDATLIGGAS